MRTVFYLCLFCLFGMTGIGAQTDSLITLGCHRPIYISPLRPCESGFRLRPPSHFRITAAQPWQRLGYGARALEPYLQSNAGAMEHLRRHRVQNNVSTVFLIGGAISSAGLGLTMIKGFMSARGTRAQENAALGWLVATAGCGTGAVLFRMQATKQLKSAVALYNEAAAAPPPRPTLTLSTRPGGLGWSLRF